MKVRQLETRSWGAKNKEELMQLTRLSIISVIFLLYKGPPKRRFNQMCLKGQGAPVNLGVLGEQTIFAGWRR
jgi:hypothetical protein